MPRTAEPLPIDLELPAAKIVRLLEGVRDDQLAAPTPCTDTPVAALLDHLMGLSLAFTWAARKTPPASHGPAPGPGTSRAADLDSEWRTALPARLSELVEAWRDPSAWQGMTEAGGVTMPGAVMAAVACDELVLHGWDLARATGQPFSCDPASTAVVLDFASESAEPENADQRAGLFGPVVEVPADASDFDRALGFAGRNPDWEPPA